MLKLSLVLANARADSFIQNADDRARIEQALPAKAVAQPTKPRRLLIFTLNVGYGGHPSIAHANEAFTLMGRKTGAFELTVSSDPAVFQRGSYAQVSLLAPMHKWQIICPVAAMLLFGLVFGPVAVKSQHRGYIRVATRSIGSDVIKSTNAAHLVHNGPDLQARQVGVNG